MTNANEELIHRFYTAFSRGDAQGMIDCYHDDVEFSDPAFGPLNSQQVRAMWKMLAERSKGQAKVTFRDIWADDKKGGAYWEAVYPFSKTGRTVHNKIHAAFELKDGKIYRHHDRFSLWAWASMALGPVGLLLGFTPLVRSRIRKEALLNLDAFMKQAAASERAS